ncbi:MAG: P27 family phage terminase small subunit [Candidatus Rokubacteria bacterium]|nr:P27 family phage terminase small subunit [Candidatus Rokubacteria bacterium]MBI3109307.1 P27 family phage terminase small subunit [Candidatus Rokubacteria bacterium]
MTHRDSPKAPRHLRAATRNWWASVVAEYELEEHHVRLLTAAAESWDRAQQAREALARHGLVYKDRFGAPRARPEVAVERDARTAFARLVRELALDVEPPASEPRPPGIRGRR